MFTRLYSLTLAVMLLGFSVTAGWAQTQPRQKEQAKPITYTWQPTILVDCPTAGTLKRGTFNAIMQVYPGGGVLGATNIGLSNRLMVGVSYGAEGLIAEEKPNWNPRIEFDVKLSVVDERIAFPAISLGFCSQGYGTYHDDLERYDFKSKGFYIVASKNYPFLKWQLGTHGGFNYSTEQEDKDENIDFFVGIDTRLNKDVGLVMEYDFGVNDNKDLTSYGKGQGYLNLALQWLYADNLVMEVMLKNLNNNRKGIVDIWRGFRVTYVEHF